MTWLLIGFALISLSVVLFIGYCAFTSELVADALTDESHMDTEGEQ